MKLWGIGGTSVILIGFIVPVMLWFEYDINLYKPRMS